MSASPLSQYNLILSGDLNVSGGSGHIEGQSFIGGHLQQASIFGDSVKVVGNLNDSSIQVQSGTLSFEGSNNMGPAGSIAACAGASCLNHVTNGALSSEKASIFSSLQSDSTYYSGLASSVGSSYFGDSNNKTLQYNGVATDLAVFTISAAELAGANWNVSFGSALNFLVNVTGTVFNAGNAKTGAFQNYADNVLWHFVDATDLNFGDSWYGNVLALNATIHTNSNLKGAVAAKSYVGNGEIHEGVWQYTPPNEVPEPSALLLIGLAVFGIAGMRWQASR